MSTSLIDQLHRLMQTTELEVAWPMLLDALREYGFDRALYATTRFRTEYAFGNIEDATILTNYPPEYMERFIGEEFYIHAPTVLWVAQNPGAYMSWSAVNKAMIAGALTPQQERVMAFNAEFDLTAGVTVSFSQISRRASGGIGLASTLISQDEIDALWAEKGMEIRALCAAAHLKIGSLPYSGQRSLTKRQREALEMVADGKTIQDIACLWARNTATVEKHLRLARDALEVETTAQAVLKASLLNQFFLIQVPG